MPSKFKTRETGFFRTSSGMCEKSGDGAKAGDEGEPTLVMSESESGYRSWRSSSSAQITSGNGLKLRARIHVPKGVIDC